ncbi:hypothetical protein [Achromobacter insolitus]|uniref:hypothetical protein n=1 Tax=Achromobacter insolitus TaxID=217204 RepID=UPI0020A4D98A|nr:hypothetical protein [Achromobacter insolitus]MCP1404269.1 hypothetical protein [Achromobacter insolitus]
MKVEFDGEEVMKILGAFVAEKHPEIAGRPANGTITYRDGKYRFIVEILNPSKEGAPDERP